MKYSCVLLPVLFALTSASELTRCCSGGARHFRQESKCSQIRTEGSGVSCTLAASICCLRAFLDESCDEGTSTARNDASCSANFNVFGGGIKKECCECCLLAKELSRQGKDCSAPVGFSSACLKSFNKCCTLGTSTRLPQRKVYSRPESMDLRQAEDRCATAKCAHFCNDRGGEDVECSCRNGYDLAPDGFSCVDIDECSQAKQDDVAVCKTNEKCENLEGGYRCYYPVEQKTMQDSTTSEWEETSRNSAEVEINSRLLLRAVTPKELATSTVEPEVSEQTVNPAVSCPDGWNASETGECVDIDECLLLADDCLEGQLCLNIPGSFKCIRTLSCGTGYALSSETEQCIDVDECNLGSHDCGPLYHCRNTQGSYRCDPKTCPQGQIMNYDTGECSVIDCALGYKPSENGCVDVNECEIPGRCGQFEECINTPGSYRCEERGNLCANGYQMDKNTGFCIDIDECAAEKHTCGDRPCVNLQGTYRCECAPGFDFNRTTMRCEDIDECEKTGGHVCSLQATCTNTVGSFTCKCNSGYTLAKDGRNCEDIDECQLGIANCAQGCINIPGSYQCTCEQGYEIAADGITCQDIDECAHWAGYNLCMGECINIPGSWKCECPAGYELRNFRECVDIDECQKNECQGSGKLCVNTLGSFKCHRIECPKNFVHDKTNKNRCNRSRDVCDTLTEVACKNIPLYISWQYTAIPRLIPINDHRTSVTLFTIKGPTNNLTTAHFELLLKRSYPEHPRVIPAVRSNFLLQKGDQVNSAVIAIRDSLDGPQEVHLELVLRLGVSDNFYGKYLANLIIYVGAYKRHRPF